MSKKLKVGTKVLLDKIKLGRNTPTGCAMPNQMIDMVGRVVTIKKYLYSTEVSHRYKVEECHTNWTYTDEMFSVWVPKNIIGGQLI